MKQVIITIIKLIGFFLGWAILTSILPLSSSENPAIWRLWAEITPLLAIIAFTYIFWLIEKKTVKLYLFDNPGRGVVLGVVTGMIIQTCISPLSLGTTFYLADHVKLKEASLFYLLISF